MGKKAIAIGVMGVMAVSLAIILFSFQTRNGPSAVAHNISIGSQAPDFGFSLANGTATDLSAYNGHPVVLWFVATWCPSCAQGNQALNQNYKFFKQHGIKIVELELYKDLGYSGPQIGSFVDSYAPAAYSNGTIIPAIAGYNMTSAYDPKGYLDAYYLLSSSGRVLYINGSPAATLDQLEQAVNASI